MMAIYRPQRPGMRPDGIGRFGSLIASTSRSNQSLTACDVPQTIGPASSMPATRNGQRVASGSPLDTTPHMNAHIGGNHVTGLSNSRMARGSGRVDGGAGLKAATASTMGKGYA